MVSCDATVLIVDSSSANFALASSCDDETSNEISEASFAFFFLWTLFAYVMNNQPASPTDT